MEKMEKLRKDKRALSIEMQKRIFELSKREEFIHGRGYDRKTKIYHYGKYYGKPNYRKIGIRLNLSQNTIHRYLKEQHDSDNENGREKFKEMDEEKRLTFNKKKLDYYHKNSQKINKSRAHKYGQKSNKKIRNTD